MKIKIIFLTLITMLSFGMKSIGQTTPSKAAIKPKTVLIINAHLTYPGLSEGKLNKAFFDKAKEFFLSQNFKVLETKVESGYNIDEEVEKHLQADIIILQTPVNWISTPWIYKKYVDEVFTSAMFSKKFISGDGRSETDPSKQYGTGGKMQGKKFMISATWNAAEKDFNDPAQYLFQGKKPADVFFNITTNYRFSGFEILEGYNCFNVFHNTHIKQDLENYPIHLKKVLGL
ncbi:NAD(P)H-dependent oxidoreductase [Flavobacterium sp. CF136]|uniref:NAD(P)H-dependent oxidoreductase n=1 Tax=Flavobacterium sp. (strain CF136) TaxID=1144313 RepID=UPI000271964C|nr:NAD(P)H-dependent oxidoreductase [Flavobacterium sp. CF136]EJL65846.1 putative NADPH-quinone reductase (modulator of drug activity B) [Flavobacterium sp. CF136]